MPDGGGRVTELVARPLLNLHAPQLAGFVQPLAGEFAARRALLEQLSFPVGYGVEIATLIDACRVAGLDALAQVDLGERQNRHQSLRALSAMAYAVMVAAERRFGRPDLDPGRAAAAARRRRRGEAGAGAGAAAAGRTRARPAVAVCRRSLSEG